MITNNYRKKFDTAGQYTNLDSLLEHIKNNPLLTYEKIFSSFAMLLAIEKISTKEHNSWYDSITFQNLLIDAKIEIDKALNHQYMHCYITSKILLAVQYHIEDVTIACTEWATTLELYDVVCREIDEILDEKWKYQIHLM